MTPVYTIVVGWLSLVLLKRVDSLVYEKGSGRATVRLDAWNTTPDVPCRARFRIPDLWQLGLDRDLSTRLMEKIEWKYECNALIWRVKKWDHFLSSYLRINMWMIYTWFETLCMLVIQYILVVLNCNEWIVVWILFHCFLIVGYLLDKIILWK